MRDRIGLLFAVNTIVIVLFEMILVNFIRPFRKLRVIAVGQFLSCIGFGLLLAGRWGTILGWPSLLCIHRIDLDDRRNVVVATGRRLRGRSIQHPQPRRLHGYLCDVVFCFINPGTDYWNALSINGIHMFCGFSP